MSATSIVVLVLWIEGTAIGLALTSILGYALFTRYAVRRRDARLSRARGIIAAHLEDLDIPPAQLAELRRLPRRELIRLYFDVAPSVGEAERRWLQRLAGTLGLLVTARDRTQSSRWWMRLSGSRLLSLVGADPEVMYRLLDDPDSIVRAQAASFVALYPNPAGIEGLVAMLGDADAICRFASMDALMRLGARATPIVVARLAEPVGATTISLLEVACATASHEHMPAALAHIADPRPDARFLVARLLRGIGGPAAADQLTALLRDGSESVREAAAEALGFLNHWPAAPAVAALLNDSVSSVRLSAAGALDRLGPPGELLLRRAKSRGTETASAAARRILDDASRAPTTLASKS